MWQKLKLSLDTPAGILLLTLIALLAILCSIYAILIWRKRKKDSELARLQRYDQIKRP